MKVQCAILLLACCLASRLQSTSATLDWIRNIFSQFGGSGGGYGGGYYSGIGGGFGSSLFSRHPWLMKKGKELFGGGRRPTAAGSGWVGGGGSHTSGGYFNGQASSGHFQNRPWFGQSNNYYRNGLQYGQQGGHLVLPYKK